MKKFCLWDIRKKKKIFECFRRKEKKKEYTGKNIQKKHNIDTKKKTRSKTKKKKKISQHRKPLDLCHPGDYVPICNSTIK